MKYSLLHLLIITLNCSLFTQGSQIIFEQRGYSDLASWVRCMYQDSRGFLWVGTVDELRRFDGYDLLYYEPQPGDTTSLSGTNVQCIHEDHAGMLWIGTFSDGLNKYDRYTDTFTRYQHEDNNPLSISGNRINAIYEDRGHTLWVGAEDVLNKFDRETDHFVGFKQDRKWITSITEDENGMLWVATWKGLFLFDRLQEIFIPFGEYFEVNDVFKNRPTMVCYRDSSNNFWIGTEDLYRFIKEAKIIEHYPIKTPEIQPLYSKNIKAIWDAGHFLWIGKGDGLYQFNKKDKTFIRHIHDPDNHLSLLENDITAILKDRSGCYWFSGYSKGINKRNTIRENVKYYLPNPFDGGSIEDAIRTLCLSKSGKIWIGTGANGFLSYDKGEEQFSVFQHNPEKPNSLSSNDIRCIIEDRHGYVWIGTYNGLNKYDPVSNRFFLYTNNRKNENSLSHNRIRSLLEASDGSIYVGTSNGLNHLNPETEKFTRFLVDRNDPHSISNNTILTIYEDSDSFIWIGTQGGGLNRFDPKSRRFFHYKNNLRDSLSISSNTVHAIYEFPFENRPTLWIGTKGGGLCRLDEETGQFFTYSKMDGLPGNQVEEIITDKKGNFWLATVDNITMFNPEEVIFKNYELSAEMPVNPHACLIDQDGEIFFGGSCGMVRFHPDSLKDNPYQPPVVITKLRVNNQPAQLDTVITEKNRLVLSYNQNNLTFEFSALDFNRPEMNQYAYKLEGLDKTWVYTDASRRYAAYTYIDPGKYVFQIKGSNNDGVWNEEGTSLTIIITPPWWRTNLAYGLYFILAISFLYSAWRVQMSRIKMKHDLEIEHLHAEKLEEVDRMKSHFFANISHEFRTPLTLILGPLEHLLSCYTDEDSRQNLKIMKRSAKRLKRLISQLLDLSKLETGQWKLRVKEENIVTLLRGYVQAFESLAKLKNIKLIFKADQNNILAYIDREKLETIINNLLSNAFKFTREGGAVSIDFGLRNAELEDKSKIRIPRLAGAAGQAKSKIAVISISDTGCGIPAESLPHIFDRFYQAGDTYTREQEGTGIGLALTKELVEFHKGKISVTSTVGKGTTFVIHLPLEKEAYTSGEIADTTIPVILPIPVQEDKPVREIIDLESWPDHEIKKTGKKFLPLLLVVEDNHDMRTYIRSNMENDYRIIEAEDGEEGFNRSIKAIPDLIISDVMMPKMDGFALCAKLKEDERTSHIPIILLTARASHQDRIGGLETGADDYIIKPFNAEELKVRVRNLIEQRRKLRERFRKEGFWQPQEIVPSSTDQKFLDKALEIVKSNLSDEHFNVEIFSKEIGMSRALLYRKLLALTDYSPSQFIRSMRLNHAAQLLAKQCGNVTEIAFQVGFNNLSYFTRCFQRQFGVVPSLYSHKSSDS